MGHTLLGRLPHTKEWKDVIALIAVGADAPHIAEAVIKASEKAYDLVQNDQGFNEVVAYLVELGLAASGSRQAEALNRLGIGIEKETTGLDVVCAIDKYLRDVLSQRRLRSDFSEIAVKSLVQSFSPFLDSLPGNLFGDDGAEVQNRLSELRKPTVFGKMGRNFFENLTYECMQYFLSRTLTTHVGDDMRFATTNQVCQFEDAIRVHCNESSEIVETFCGDWFSKHRHESGGEIPRDKSKGFGWHAINKMRSELTGDNERYDCGP